MDEIQGKINTIEPALQNPEIQIREFNELSPYQVARLYALRYNVFVREQKSIYDEHDGKDFQAKHLFVEEGDGIIAYARICREQEGIVSIGRIVVDQRYRKQKLGEKIVGSAIEQTRLMPGVKKINIGAQLYLQKFYESFGFVTTSEPYDDEGVMHINMSLDLHK
mgnify:FL=1